MTRAVAPHKGMKEIVERWFANKWTGLIT